jgi:hypothetical protein
MVGIGALAIPGLGRFIAAGPIMAALAGAGAGAAAGGLTGALIGMGIPELESKTGIYCCPSTRKTEERSLGRRKS